MQRRAKQQVGDGASINLPGNTSILLQTLQAPTQRIVDKEKIIGGCTAVVIAMTTRPKRGRQRRAGNLKSLSMVINQLQPLAQIFGGSMLNTVFCFHQLR